MRPDALPLAGGLLTEPPLHRFIEAIHTEPFGPQRILHPIGDYLAAEHKFGRLDVVPADAAVTGIIYS